MVWYALGGVVLLVVLISVRQRLAQRREKTEAKKKASAFGAAFEHYCNKNDLQMINSFAETAIALDWTRSELIELHAVEMENAEQEASEKPKEKPEGELSEEEALRLLQEELEKSAQISVVKRVSAAGIIRFQIVEDHHLETNKTGGKRKHYVRGISLKVNILDRHDPVILIPVLAEKHLEDSEEVKVAREKAVRCEGLLHVLCHVPAGNRRAAPVVAPPRTVALSVPPPQPSTDADPSAQETEVSPAASPAPVASAPAPAPETAAPAAAPAEPVPSAPVSTPAPTQAGGTRPVRQANAARGASPSAAAGERSSGASKRIRPPGHGGGSPTSQSAAGNGSADASTGQSREAPRAERKRSAPQRLAPRQLDQQLVQDRLTSPKVFWLTDRAVHGQSQLILANDAAELRKRVGIARGRGATWYGSARVQADGIALVVGGDAGLAEEALEAFRDRTELQELPKLSVVTPEF